MSTRKRLCRGTAAPSVASLARGEPGPAAQARLACADAAAQGWLLDGYPRSAEQAEAIQEAGIRPDIFILIQARAADLRPAAPPGLRPRAKPCDWTRHDAGLPCAPLPGVVEGPARPECLPASPLRTPYPGGAAGRVLSTVSQVAQRGSPRGRAEAIGPPAPALPAGTGLSRGAGAQVPDEELVERVTGRRLDPETGEIYHLRFKPPPAHAAGRLQQRSDDTEDKLRTRLATHHANVAAVVGYYKDVLVQARARAPGGYGVGTGTLCRCLFCRGRRPLQAARRCRA